MYGGICIPEFIYSMFFPMIGKGIETYRNYLIQRLIKMGQNGDILWQKIMSDSFSMIQGGREPGHPKPFVCPLPFVFPPTLQEAQEKYGNRSHSSK